MNSPLHKIETSWSSDINLYIKRDDLIHPLISGNKYRKLKYNIVEVKAKGGTTLLSFGGAYSNHIHALSMACKIHGFKSIGIIRGEEIRPLNPTLQYAEDNGMELHWVSRSDYRLKSEDSFIEGLKIQFGDFYLVPEGGTNDLAIKGTAELIAEIDIPFDYISTAVGTGGTIAGLINTCPVESKVLGFSALKGDFLIEEVKGLIKENTKEGSWEINCDYHFGGYAKVKPELWDFMDEFKKETDIQLEPIYNGKMLYGIKDLVNKGFFMNGETIIAIHTGGLQGLLGFKRK